MTKGLLPYPTALQDDLISPNNLRFEYTLEQRWLGSNWKQAETFSITVCRRVPIDQHSIGFDPVVTVMNLNHKLTE